MQIPPFTLDRQFQEIGFEIESEVSKVLKGGQYIGGQEIAKFEESFSTPIRFEKLSSNLAISCPPIYCPTLKTLEYSLSISEPISWNCLSKVNGGICIVNILTLNHISMGKKNF